MSRPEYPTASRFAGLKSADEPTLRDKLRAIPAFERWLLILMPTAVVVTIAASLAITYLGA